ncbi:molybdate ABC transporter, permease protein [Synechococcus sp. PCC 7502]|uniref:molybdate ABC transporter permease subunit n=1 Tax=Synechococcus sp. PCC 7502 TaxID=1173263 RepID=UPI00029FB023|nr:molybdate ABC transporter permease subunit [Synechococcus sp. PCC 7502]AFY74005.1 molybdate ABC transporter, permease protein [Synechococcus sp. PCC 7502]
MSLLPNLSPLWISLKVSVIATVITFCLGVGAGYGMFYYRGRGRSLINSLFLIPLVLPPTVVGFILLLLLGKNGVIGQLISRLAIQIVFTWYGAVLAAIVIAFPLMYRASLGAFQQIDPLLLDAARVEGASELEVFSYIAFPLALPGILSGTVLAFTRALGEFGATLMLAGNIPEQTQTMPMAIYFAVEAGEFKEGGFWVALILCISLTAVFTLDYLNPKSNSYQN